ncbi:MAG: carboxypeptidase-like regulatory domain-containing protein, partial [Bradymonadaceae bacterium]
MNAPSNLRSVQGNVVFSPARGAGPDVRNVEGARVYAVSADGRFTSTVDRTDGSGRFSLRYPPDTGPYDIRVERAGPTDWIPRTTFDDAITADNQSPRLEPLDLGEFPGPDRRLSVELQMSAADGTAGPSTWRGTTVVLTTRLGRGLWRTSHPVETDGTVSLRVLPVEHEVRIRPRPDAAVGPRTLSIDFGENVPEDAIELPATPVVEGRVRDSLGKPLAGADLEFEPLDLDTNGVREPGTGRVQSAD